MVNNNCPDWVGCWEFHKCALMCRMVAAEWLGTLLLVLFGCSSIIFGSTDILRIGLTFGLVIASVVQALGHVSGGHVNPAVTLSFLVTGDITLVRACFFILFQIGGGAAGAGILYAFAPKNYNGTLGITSLGKSVTEVQGLFMELILTFFLVLVIHGVCDMGRGDLRGSASLAIGLCITACHLTAIPYTGSSLNPARSFGPAVVANFWKSHWVCFKVYWVGPICGGIMAGLSYKYFFKVRAYAENLVDG